ncbi:HAMP domain-containing sensor histidine kinase [Neobacillus sp. PS2-9]|uniref:sensor histidine kinase n=1 Tax=Neobacillus sp. PS2-9 TaxID=3070676 RepID=UPI0027E05249|nr:HAMP domain-containing sensor histidine kinase [Neobacillus sp. PS2-9]WML56631.1 HAMP domain-containing sensor histidine kinase [Neobacillus sp. PS2-9]
MSIRFRLVLSYLAMILVPIFFVVVSALLVALLFRGDIKELKNIYLPPEHQHDISKNDQLYIDLHRNVLKNPGRFSDKKFLKQFDSQFIKEGGTGIILRKGIDVIYQSDSLKHLNKDDLPIFGVFGDVDPVEEIDHQVVSIKKIDFIYPDNTEGSLFLVTDASSFSKFVRSFFPALFIGLIIILIITNGLLTYYVSRSILVPIRQLQKAAKEMKEGNLNDPITPLSKDELGQLAQGFDEMRTKLKESIEKQVAYEENRRELIANISHDLKTPITTIKGYVEGIRDGVANSPEKIDRYLQTIYSKSIDLDHMIDELFLYSKLDLQRLPFHFEKINFDHFLQDFVEELRFEVEELSVYVDLKIEGNSDYLILGDREHLKRVITNIVDNSLKYNDKEARKLSFHLSTKDTKIQFEIEDNGPGIAEGNLPVIFNRFYREDKARGTEKGGSGLGLSIAKRIIEEHHGRIWAESKKGQGTTILFTLDKAGVESEKDLNSRR